MKPPRAITFDLDNTLLDGTDFSNTLAQTCAAVAARCVGLTPEALLLANDRAWRAYWPTVEKDWTLGTLSGAEVTEEAWRRTLTTCDYHDESLVRLAVEAHSHHSRLAYKPYDDACQLLRFLKNRMGLGLITNGAADTQQEKLDAIGMGAVFEASAISGELGIAKPDREIFRFALDQLGVAAEDAWHVGDSPATDINGARSAGVTAIWLNRSGTERQQTDPEPDLEIRSLAEIAPLLGDSAGQSS